MDIWVKMVSFQIIQNVLNVKTTLLSWLKEIKFDSIRLNTTHHTQRIEVSDEENLKSPKNEADYHGVGSFMNESQNLPKIRQIKKWRVWVGH